MYFNINSCLFVAYLFGMLYSHKIAGLKCAEFVPISIVAAFVLARSIQFGQIRRLAQIFGVALLATAIALFSFPGALPEYIKSLGGYAFALLCGYMAYLTALSVGRRGVSRICLICSVVIIGASVAEVLIPQLHTLSMTLQNAQFASSTVTAESHEERDLALHGGIWRPILGSQEPSYVGIALGLCLAGWNLTRDRRNEGDLLLFVLGAIAIVVLRSPAFMVIFLAGNSAYFIGQLFSGGPKGVFLAITFCIAAALGIYFLRERVERMWMGEDNSFKERISLAVEFTIVALRDTWGMGIGFMGNPIEPDNPKALDDVYPLIVEALERAEYLGVIRNRRDNQVIPAGELPMLTHWFYHGIPLGILSLFYWTKFVRVIDARLIVPFFFSFIVISSTGSGYESLKLSVMQFLMFAFLQMDLEGRDAMQRAG